MSGDSAPQRLPEPHAFVEAALLREQRKTRRQQHQIRPARHLAVFKRDAGEHGSRFGRTPGVEQREHCDAERRIVNHQRLAAHRFKHGKRFTRQVAGGLDEPPGRDDGEANLGMHCESGRVVAFRVGFRPFTDERHEAAFDVHRAVGHGGDVARGKIALRSARELLIRDETFGEKPHRAVELAPVAPQDRAPDQRTHLGPLLAFLHSGTHQLVIADELGDGSVRAMRRFDLRLGDVAPSRCREQRAKLRRRELAEHVRVDVVEQLAEKLIRHTVAERIQRALLHQPLHVERRDRPAFRELVRAEERRHVRVCLGEQLCHLRAVEREVVGAQRRDQMRRGEIAQTHGKRPPCAQDQLSLPRSRANERGDRLEHARIGRVLEAVENERDRFGEPPPSVDEVREPAARMRRENRNGG